MLVVEDDWFLANEICQGLRRCGAKPLGPASTLQEARKLANSPDFRCAILDIKLRGEVSLPFARELSALNVPFVYVTGYDDAVIPELPLGAAHLTKPVDVEKLVNLVDALCRDFPRPAQA